MSVLKKSAHIFIGRFFQAMSSLIIIMIASRLLTQGDYGTYRQVYLIYEILAPILGLGLFNSVYYFLVNDTNHKELFFKIVKIILCVCSLILILPFTPLSNKLAYNFSNPDIIQFLIYVFPITFFALFIPIINAYFIHYNLTKSISIYNSIFSFILVLFTLVFLLIFKTIHSLFLVRIILYSIFTIFIVWKLFKTTLYKHNYGYSTTYTQIIKYSIPLGLASIIGVLSMNLDKMLISFYYDPVLYGIYSNGAIEVPAIGLITGTLTTVSLTEFAKYCKNNKFNEAKILFRKIAEIGSYFLFPCMVFLLFFSKNLMILFYGIKFEASYLPFTVYLFLLPIRIIMYGPILIALGKAKIIFVRSIIELIINILLSIFLLKWLGYIGVAIATVLSVLLWSVPYNLISISKTMKIHILELVPLKRLGMVLFISIVSIIPFLLIIVYCTINSIVFLLCGLTYSFMVLFWFLKNNYLPVNGIREKIKQYF